MFDWIAGGNEVRGPVGAFVGELEFEVVVISHSTLTEFTVSELFVMEAEGTITIKELVA